MAKPASRAPLFRRWSFWRRWLGQRSERFAARYLRKLGYRILAVNVADDLGELDLIAIDGQTLVVVEVRSVVGTNPQLAAESVDYGKQKKITEAALRFLSRRRALDVPVRFDVLALAWPTALGPPELLHLTGAFEATGRFQPFS